MAKKPVTLPSLRVSRKFALSLWTELNRLNEEKVSWGNVSDVSRSAFLRVLLYLGLKRVKSMSYPQFTRVLRELEEDWSG